MVNKRENYKAALEHIQRVQQAGGWVKFDAIKKQYHLRNVTKKALIPDLREVDLTDEAEVDRLYKIQEDFIATKVDIVRQHNVNRYRYLRDRVKELEAENELLRQRIK